MVEGTGKPGFVKGEATRIELVEQNETTIVNVKGQGQVGGLIARVGQRLLGTVSKMMMDRFFGVRSGESQGLIGTPLRVIPRKKDRAPRSKGEGTGPRQSLFSN